MFATWFQPVMSDGNGWLVPVVALGRQPHSLCLPVSSPRTENHFVPYSSRMFSRRTSVWSSLGNCLCSFFSGQTPVCHLRSPVTPCLRLCSRAFLEEQEAFVSLTSVSACLHPSGHSGKMVCWANLPASQPFTVTPQMSLCNTVLMEEKKEYGPEEREVLHRCRMLIAQED